MRSWYRFLVLSLAACVSLFSCSGAALAQTAISTPAGAPSWGSTAVNLEFRPITGTTKIAYVNPLDGDDGAGQVYVYDAADGDYRLNNTDAPRFATGDAAIAAIGTREGPHAVLFANADSSATHTVPVVNGGCQGQDSAHPWYFGVYWPLGAPGATAASNMAIFDPGIDNDAAGIVTTLVTGWVYDDAGMWNATVAAGLDIDGMALGEPPSKRLAPGEFGNLSEGEWAYSGTTLQVYPGDGINADEVDVYRRARTGSATAMFSAQRGGGISNLMIEGLYFRLDHRIAYDDAGAGNGAYVQTDALDPCNNWRSLRVYGNSTNVLVRNCRENGCTEGFSIEGIANANGSRISNVVLDRCVLQDTWQASGTYENIFVSYADRFRMLNCVNLGSGWNRFDSGIGPGDTAQGRCQGTYLSFCKEPWIDNTIVGLASNAGIQARCGGFITRCLSYANADGFAFGHGQNEYESAPWAYEAVGSDLLVWGTKPVGGTNENGRGIGWGRCKSLKLDRYVIVGTDDYRAGDNNWGLNIGTTSGGTTVRVGPGCTYDWNASGVSASAACSMQNGSSNGATVTITGLRPYEKRGYLFYSEGTEGTTRNRWQSSTLVAGRYDKNGTAATYGPSGSTPAKITAGGVEGYAKRPNWSGGSAPHLYTLLGFSSEAAMLRAWTSPLSRWDASHVINKVNPEFGFATLRGIDAGEPNVP